jgi:hypothetical protein
MPKNAAISATRRRISGVGDAQALQAEGQLVPDPVRDDLALRRLPHISDGRGLPGRRQLFNGAAVQQDFAAAAAAGRQGGLDKPQQRGLSAAGGPAERHKFPPAHPEGRLPQSGTALAGVGEGHRPEFQALHLPASQLFKITGSRHKAA